MENGILVAVPGYAVETAEDINLSLKTDFTLLKVKASGTASMATQSATIAHGLGYLPQFLVFGLKDTGEVISQISNYSGVSVEGVIARVDTSNLYIASNSNVDSAYYFIFYEQL